MSLKTIRLQDLIKLAWNYNPLSTDHPGKLLFWNYSSKASLKINDRSVAPNPEHIILRSLANSQARGLLH